MNKIVLNIQRIKYQLNCFSRFILKQNEDNYLVYTLPIAMIFFGFLSKGLYPSYIKQSFYQKGAVSIEKKIVVAEVTMNPTFRGQPSVTFKSKEDNWYQSCVEFYIEHNLCKIVGDSYQAIYKESDTRKIRKEKNENHKLFMTLDVLKVVPNGNPTDRTYSILGGRYIDKNGVNASFKTHEKLAYEWFYGQDTNGHQFLFLIFLNLIILFVWMLVLLILTLKKKGVIDVK